jgi:hypothetical protein
MDHLVRGLVRMIRMVKEDTRSAELQKEFFDSVIGG